MFLTAQKSRAAKTHNNKFIHKYIKIKADQSMQPTQQNKQNCIIIYYFIISRNASRKIIKRISPWRAHGTNMILD